MLLCDYASFVSALQHFLFDNQAKDSLSIAITVSYIVYIRTPTIRAYMYHTRLRLTTDLCDTQAHIAPTHSYVDDTISYP